MALPRLACDCWYADWRLLPGCESPAREWVVKGDGEGEADMSDGREGLVAERQARVWPYRTRLARCADQVGIEFVRAGSGGRWSRQASGSTEEETEAITVHVSVR